MYKKKLGVRVITAITVGALLSSNMSVAMANTQIATLEDNLDEKTADEEKNVEEEETETVDETVEETETEETEEEESTDEIEESDSEKEVTGDEEDTVETEEEETPVEEKREEETDKEEEAPAETDDPSGASDDAEELPAEETEEETDTAEEGVTEENTDAEEEVPAEEETVSEEENKKTEEEVASEEEKNEQNETTNEEKISETVEASEPVEGVIWIIIKDENDTLVGSSNMYDISEIDTNEDGQLTEDELSGLYDSDKYEFVAVSDSTITPGNTYVVTVKEKVQSTIINVVFTDAQGNNVGGGDYFVDEDGDGIFNYSELDVPEGYKLVVTGDAFVNDFVGKTTELKVVRDGAAIINAQFVDEDGNVIAGGDYFVDEDGDGIFNYSELAEYVPEGYTMQTLGDAFVAEGTFIINISKDNEEPETKNVTITYVDENGKIVGTQTIEVPAGDNNINTSKLTVPEGFELVWTGDLAIEDGAVTVEVKATENPDNPDNPDPEDPDNPDNPDPEDPDNPDNPDNPDPDQPDNPNQGGSGSGSSGGSSGGSGGGSGSATGSHALRSGEWILDDIGWWYQYSDNTYAKAGWYSLVWRGNTDWYYFNEAGYLISGWFEQNGNRYFLHDVHDGTFGRMYTGWNQVEGQWYFFNDNADNGTVGALVEGAQVPAELLNQ